MTNYFEFLKNMLLIIYWNIFIDYLNFIMYDLIVIFTDHLKMMIDDLRLLIFTNFEYFTIYFLIIIKITKRSVKLFKLFINYNQNYLILKLRMFPQVLKIHLHIFKYK
jgi:hypothetical protein